MYVSIYKESSGGVLKYISDTGMCRTNGSFFHKNSLDMGPLFQRKNA